MRPRNYQTGHFEKGAVNEIAYEEEGEDGFDEEGLERPINAISQMN